jgi:P-type Cu+ transporter
VLYATYSTVHIQVYSRAVVVNMRSTGNLEVELSEVVVDVSSDLERYKVKLLVEGMTCSSCVSTVESGIKMMKGDIPKFIEDVHVDLLQESARVVYLAKDEGNSQKAAGDIVDTVESLGFECKIVDLEEVPESVAEDTGLKFESKFLVEGMTCSSCVATVETAIKKCELKSAVERVRVDLLSDSMTITYSAANDEEAREMCDAVVETVEMVGFDCKHVDSCSYASKKNQVPSQPLKMLFDFSGTDFGAQSAFDTVGRIKDALEGVDGVKSVRSFGFYFRDSEGSARNKKSPARDRADELRLVVTYDDLVVGVRSICKRVEQQIGAEKRFEVGPVKTLLDSLQKRKSDHVKAWQRAFLISAAFTVPCVLVSMVLPSIPSIKHALHKNVFPGLQLPWSAFLMWIFATPVQFGSGRRFYEEAYTGIKKGNYGMAFLIATGTSAAYFYSAFAVLYSTVTSSVGTNKGAHFFETSAMLISFVLLGKLLEATAKKETSSAISALSKLSAKSAFLIDNFSPNADVQSEALTGSRIHIDMVQRGDIIKVVPGDTLPADGVVVRGESSVNESMLTGESMPVRKCVGDTVVGSTSNVDGMLFVRVTETGPNTSLSNIINLVQEAQVSKPKIQIFAERVSGIFAPVIASIALLTFVVWMVLTLSGTVPKAWYPYGESDVVMSLTFSIAVLVIACPCALGLATPTAIMVGTSVGASLGILVKSGDALEAAQSVTDIVFDKTGTLTNGKPTVTSVVVFPKLPPLLPVTEENSNAGPLEEKSSSKEKRRLKEADLLFLVGSVERGSEHPLGRAIVAKAEESEGVPDLIEPESFKAMPGRGVCAIVSGNTVLIGNRQYMADQSCVLEDENMVEESMTVMESQGKTCVLVGVNGVVAGMLSIHDEKKKDAAVTLAALRAMNLTVWMLTGDNRRTAEAIAFELGIDKKHVVAEVLPNEKSEKVVELQSQNKYVAMVGDGVNDSPALAQANLGIAIGAGADVAIEAADLVLVNSRLRDVITAIDLSRTVYRRIRLNMIWALGYNVCGIPIAAGVFFPLVRVVLPPEVAGLAMALSSVSVVLSSILLKRYRPPEITPSFGRTVRHGGALGIEKVVVVTHDMFHKTQENDYHVDPGCMMAFNGPCTCDAELCRCQNCTVHVNQRLRHQAKNRRKNRKRKKKGVKVECL